MSFEQPGKIYEQQERQRAIEKLIEIAEIVDEGADGVILKIIPTTENDILEEILKKIGISFDKEAAVKLLKIFRPGTIAKEFSHQQRAFSVLGSGNAQRAGAPQPLLYETFMVTDEIGKRIPEISHEDYGELMIMEFVPGIDLERRIYHKASSLMSDVVTPDITSNQVDILRSPVNIALGMAIVNEQTGAATHLRQDNGENRKLMSFLRRKGVKIQGAVLLQIEEALTALHARGIHHNDLHARNIIIDGDIFSEDAEVKTYIIDYGRSVEENQESVLFDGEIIELLKRICPDYERAKDLKRKQQEEARALARSRKHGSAAQQHEEVIYTRTDEVWRKERVEIWQKAAKAIMQINPYNEQRIYNEIVNSILQTTHDSTTRDQRIMDIFGMLYRHFPKNTQQMQFSIRALQTALQQSSVPTQKITSYIQYYTPET